MRRLSYADRRVYGVVFAAGLLASIILGYWIYSSASMYARALGDRYISDEIYYVDVARRILINVFGVKNHTWYPWSGETASDYYNPEHPPLGKYLIALSMILCGDRPYCWRLPGIIEGAAIPVILYIGYALSRRDLIGPLAGFVAALAAASSLSIRYEASVAMLDIHQAFFTSIAIAALASESVSTSIVAAGLASSVKYSGAFIIPAIWAYTASRVSTRRKRAIIFLETIAVPPLIVVALSTPLILHFGWKWFWENSVVGALKWHTTSRPAGPPVSSPGGWLVNANPFYFDYDTLIGGVTNSVLQVTALVLGGATIIYSFWRSSWPAAGSYTYYSIIGMYLLLSHLYIFHIPGLHGNTTLYSFYAVQLAPSAAATYGDLVASHAGGDVEASAPTTRS